MIDEETYKLPLNNYINIESIKKQIVIGHTANHDMKHINGWLHRHNGNFKRTAAFTVNEAGFVFQHFDPKYQSKFFNDLEQDKKSIVILLENDGYLLENKENNFITWIGDIYNGETVVDKKWRDYRYWSPYNKEQVISLVKLIDSLCTEFVIPKVSFATNTYIDNLTEYKGILYKSNIKREYLDLSPSWNCAVFKDLLENNDNK